MAKKLLFLCLVVLLMNTIYSQTPATIGYQHYTKIKVDFSKGTFDPYTIPFDVPFVVYGTAPAEIKKATLTVTDVRTRKTFLPDDWVRDVFQTNDFHFIIPPLEAIKEYKFEFKFVRGTTQTESTELNARIQPAISTNLEALFVGTATANLPTNLQDVTNVDMNALVNDIAQVVRNYYDDKNIMLSFSDVRQMIANNIVLFVQNNFYNVMVDRATKMDNLDLQMQNGRVLVSAIAGSPLLNRLNSNAINLKLDAAETDILSNLLLNAANLDRAVLALPAPFADFVNSKKKLTTAQITAYITASAETVTKINKIKGLIKRIESNNALRPILAARVTPAQIDAGKRDLNQLLDIMMTINFLLTDYQLATQAYEKAFTDAKFDFRFNFPIDIPVPGTTTAEFVTRGEWYITADLGFASLFLQDGTKIKPYLGVNFNIFPINRQANYSLFKSIATNKWRDLKKALSVVIGLTVSSLGENEKNTDLLGSTSLLSGMGVRVTDGVRVTVGAFWTNKKSENPLFDKKKLWVNPYVSLSLDWDLRNWLKNLRKQVAGFGD